MCLWHIVIALYFHLHINHVKLSAASTFYIFVHLLISDSLNSSYLIVDSATDSVRVSNIIMYPPLKRWVHVVLPLSAQFVRSVYVRAFFPSVCPIHFCSSVQRFLLCRRSNKRCWPNAGLTMVHRIGATLNVGQHHRRWANINPALVQSIVPVLPAFRHRQHDVLTRAEWILASTSNTGPAFNRHWVDVGL